MAASTTPAVITRARTRRTTANAKAFFCVRACLFLKYVVLPARQHTEPLIDIERSLKLYYHNQKLSFRPYTVTQPEITFFSKKKQFKKAVSEEENFGKNIVIQTVFMIS